MAVSVNAEPADEVDRAGITAFRDKALWQPARQLIFTVRRQLKEVAVADTHLALLSCATASWLAYLPQQEFETRALEAGFEQVEFHQQDNHIAIIATQGANTFLAFRGIVDRLDWRDNFRLLWIKHPWGSVHRGFAGIEDLIMAKVRAAASGRPSLWLTGHSLGGALAMLAGANLHFRGAPNLAGVCTFGQPAVGDMWFSRQFRRQLGDHYFRFVNSIDAVPLAPTLAHHVGTPFYFEASEGKRCQDRMALSSAPGVTNHKPDLILS